MKILSIIGTICLIISIVMWTTLFVKFIGKYSRKSSYHPYIQLMTEESLNIGDTLMVQYISNDTIYVGYPDPKFVK